MYFSPFPGCWCWWWWCVLGGGVSIIWETPKETPSTDCMTLHRWMDGWIYPIQAIVTSVCLCVRVAVWLCVVYACLARCVRSVRCLSGYLSVSSPCVSISVCVAGCDGWILSVFKPVCSPTHSPDQSVSRSGSQSAVS